MSAFDSIAATAASDVARVKETVAPTVTKVEVLVGQRAGILRRIGTSLLALGAVVYAYHAGGEASRSRYEAFVAEERRVAEVERARQAQASAAIEDAAARRVTAAQSQADQLQRNIDSYVQELAHRPVDARCTLTDADLRGLREPLGTPRAHRRPTGAPRRSE